MSGNNDTHKTGRDEMDRDPAWYSAMEGDLAAVRRSLDEGLDVNHADKNGMTMLAVAVYYGHRAIAELLIEEGADANKVDYHGNGPLWHATREASQQPDDDEPAYDQSIVSLLLASRADPNHLNNAGRNASSWAEDEPQIQELYRAAGYEGTFE